jgi:hypothetical protein
MKKHNEPEYLLKNSDYMKFSKYQDYGFTFGPETQKPLLELIYIKVQARTLDIDNYEELEKEYTVFYIKDKGLRDKAEFENRYQEIEKENIKLREHITSLREKIDNVKRLL